MPTKYLAQKMTKRRGTTTKKPVVVIPNKVRTLPKVPIKAISQEKSFTKRLASIPDEIEIDTDDLPDDLAEIYDDVEDDYKEKVVKKNWALWLAMFTTFILPAFLKGVSGDVELPPDAQQSIQTEVPDEKQVVDYAKQYFQDRGLSLVQTLSTTDCEHLKEQMLANWGKGPDAFKAAFQEDYANTKARLDVIYRSEYVAAQNEGILARSRDAGMTHKMWNAALDERTCPVCGDQLHGTIIPIEEEFTATIEHKSGSEEISVSGPPAHPSCRCVLTTLSKEDADANEEMQQDAAYLSDAVNTIKLNYKCKSGTVDDSNKCTEGQDKPNQSEKPSIDILKSKTLENLYNNKENVILYSEKSDIAMNELAKEIGYDKKPKLVTKEELDKEISDGSLELFRGLTPDAAEQLKNGQYDARPGSYGNGIYAAVGDDSTAKFYAGDTGKVLRMSLDKNAKVVNFDDLEEEQRKYLDSFPKEYRMYSSGPSNNMDELTKEQAMHYILNDPGRFAAFRGYDAILIHHFAPENSTDINILNRSVLHIEDDSKHRQDSAYLADAVETIKLNYKCPKDSTEAGTFKCGNEGQTETITSINDLSKVSTTKDWSVDSKPDPNITLPGIILKPNEQLYTHATRYSSDIENIVQNGLKNTKGKFFASEAPLVRDRGSGFVIFKADKNLAKQSTDNVEPGLAYPEVSFKESIPKENIVKVVREIPTFDGQSIREDYLADYAMKNQGLTGKEVDVLPEKYQKWFNLQKQNSDYLSEVTDFIKQNLKCKAGTYDETNKCGPESKPSDNNISNVNSVFQEISTSFNPELGGFHTTDYTTNGPKPLRIISQAKEDNAKLLDALKDIPSETLPTQFTLMKMPGNVPAKYYAKLDTIGVNKNLSSQEMTKAIKDVMSTIKRNAAYLAQVADVLVLSDVATFMKQNYKCKREDSPDGSNKCGLEGKETTQPNETFIGFKADHDFAVKQDIEANKRIQSSLNKAAEPLKSFNLKDRNVLRMYSGNRFQQINQYLNGSMEKNETNDDFDKVLKEESKQLVEQMDKLFVHSELKEPLVTYRGITDNTMMKYPELMTAFDTPGSEIQFPCFCSTSALPFMVNNYADGYNGRLLELQLPEGTKALYIAEDSLLPKEYEILVNRGTKFEVGETRYTDIIHPPPLPGTYVVVPPKRVKITTIKAIV